jgi:hypothetical protein
VSFQVFLVLPAIGDIIGDGKGAGGCFLTLGDCQVIEVGTDLGATAGVLLASAPCNSTNTCKLSKMIRFELVIATSHIVIGDLPSLAANWLKTEMESQHLQCNTVLAKFQCGSRSSLSVFFKLLSLF